MFLRVQKQWAYWAIKMPQVQLKQRAQFYQGGALCGLLLRVLLTIQDPQKGGDL